VTKRRRAQPAPVPVRVGKPVSQFIPVFAPRWLSYRAAAHDAGVSINTVKRWVKSDRLRSYVPPGTRLRRIDRRDLTTSMRSGGDGRQGGATP
jgi:excisionase family DNA binding protein